MTVYAVAASSDDAFQNNSGVVSITGTALGMTTTNSYLGIRFQALGISPGSRITSAVLNLVIADSSKNDAQGTWWCEDTDDAATFTTAASSISSRTATTATVAWTTNDLGSVGDTIDTPDLATCLQEVIDRPGWVAGNDVVFIYAHNSASDLLSVASYDNTDYLEPQLTVNWILATTPGTHGLPDLVVDWRADGGSDSDGIWYDMTTYVSDAKITRGRSYDLDRFESGTATLTLKTNTRLFDPEYTSGTYYGKLLPMRQLRINAVYNSVVYPLFYGYVKSWGQTVWQDKVFVTTISVQDAFLRLEQIKLPSSAWAMEIVKDDPSLWLRLGERDTVRLTDSSDGGNYGLYDNCQQGAPGLVKNDSDSGAAFAHSLEERVVVQNPALISGYPFTISAMIKIDSSDPDGFKVVFAGLTIPSDTFDPMVGIFIGTLAGFQGRIYCTVDNGANQRSRWSNAPVDDDRPHHVAWVVTDASTHALYIDGALQNTGSTSGTGAPTWPGSPLSGWTIGNFTDLLFGDYGFGTNDVAAATAENPNPVKQRGTIDEVCVWDATSVSATRIAAHAEAALDGWDGDDTGARVDRFLDVLDWPAELRDIDTGISTLGPASWSAGSSALTVLQDWANTELGAFFMDGSGRIVWRSRHYPFLDANAMTSQATFGDAHAAATAKYHTVSLPRDETQIRNPVTASRNGGVSVTVSDSALVATYGDRSWASPVTEDQKDSAVRDRAIWLLARFKELGTRLAAMTITPQKNPTVLWPALLDLELGHRITIKRKPLGTGNEISTDQIVERIEHQFTPEFWTTTLVGSPVDPNVGDYLILDDGTYGLLDTALLAY